MNKNLHYGDITYEQPELPLEWPVHDHYTVELRKSGETIRSMRASSTEDAIGMIEGFRDSSETKDQVTWRDRDVDGTGSLVGLAPGGVVWQIHVSPNLNTELG